MSQSTPDAAQGSGNGFSTEYDYEIECSGLDRSTVHEVRDILHNSGIREEKFGVVQADSNPSGGPVLRIKGLEHDSAEDMLGHLREEGLEEIADDVLTVVILPEASE